MYNEIDKRYIPRRQTYGSAGYDIYAVEDMYIEPLSKVFDTGIRFDGEECPLFQLEYEGKNTKHEIYPRQWVALILPRSSLGFMYGMKFDNTVCVIDQDYRDSIKLSISSKYRITINKGDRFAQMIFIPYCILLDEEEPEKERDGGIGSTN